MTHLLGDGPERQESALGDAVLHDGVDHSGARRAHMRDLTMARQAAERLASRPTSHREMDRPARLAAAQERAVELGVELARIDAEHWTWLHDQGEDVPTLRKPRGVALESTLLQVASPALERLI